MQEFFKSKQVSICEKYKAPFQSCDLSLKMGVSLNVKNCKLPINGLRVKEEKGTSGWYIWSGEWSDAPDFFAPLHGYHLSEWSPIVLPYLGLPEGWRFLVTNDYEDVWHDPDLDI